MQSNAATILTMPQQQIAVYDEFRSQLTELKQLNSSLVFNYEDKQGNKDARSHVYKLRRTKAAVDKARAAEKAASLEYGKRVDAEAKEIVAQIEAMIDVHQKPLDEIETREKARVEAIQARITSIANTPNKCAGLSATEIAEALSGLKALTVDEIFGEFQLEAMQAHSGAIKALEEMHAAALHREEEARELERLRKEQAEREQKEREERIAAEAADKARREEEAKAQAEKHAAERRELQLKLEKEQAEKARLEAEQRAEQEKKDSEAKAARAVEEERARVKAAEEAKAAEDAKREADRQHQETIHAEIAAAMIARGACVDVAESLILAIRHGKIPHLKIAY